MEKDHFKDRTIDTTIVSKVKVGSYLFICEKAMQDIASEIPDLTFGRVTKILTRHNHDRGIKVCIDVITNDFDGQREIDNLDSLPSYRTAVGRVVYMTNKGKIITK